MEKTGGRVEKESCPLSKTQKLLFGRISVSARRGYHGVSRFSVHRLPCDRFGGAEKFEQTYFHRHEFFELFYIYEGTCYCYFNDQEYVLEKGSVWIFNTHCRHAVVVPDDGSLLINIIVRKSTFITAMLNMVRQNDLFLEFFLNSIYRATRTSLVL